MNPLTLQWDEGSRPRQVMLNWDPSRQYTLGRSAGCDVVLVDPDKNVSGIHGGIECRDGGYVLVNLTRDRVSPQRPNPIWVNGIKVIEQEIPLKTQTQIQMGKLVLTVDVNPVGIKSDHPLVPPSLGSLRVKCSRAEDPHLLALSYIGQNCPFCGQIVVSSTVIGGIP